TAFLYLTQPLARLRGRLQSGLTPWRRRGTAGLAVPLPRTAALWSERWLALDTRLHAIEATRKMAGAATRRGGALDSFDLEGDDGLHRRPRLQAGAPRGATVLAIHRRLVPAEPASEPAGAARAASIEDRGRQRDRRAPAARCRRAVRARRDRAFPRPLVGVGSRPPPDRRAAQSDSGARRRGAGRLHQREARAGFPES